MKPNEIFIEKCIKENIPFSAASIEVRYCSSNTDEDGDIGEPYTQNLYLSDTGKEGSSEPLQECMYFLFEKSTDAFYGALHSLSQHVSDSTSGEGQNEDSVDNPVGECGRYDKILPRYLIEALVRYARASQIKRIESRKLDDEAETEDESEAGE